MFSIVVVTWRSAEVLADLVDSMNEHLSGGEQLIVVENASEDVGPIAARWKGPHDYLPLPENVGFGAGNNAGVRLSRHPVTVLLNPDTRLVDGSLAGLAERAGRRRTLIGPKLLEVDGSRQPSAAGPVVGAWPWVRIVAPGALAPAFVRNRTEPWRAHDAVEVTWLTGACLAAPTALLRELGPFDPGLHLYSEDLDLGLRARAGGHRSVFDPTAARVVHIGDVSSGQRFGDAGASLSARNARAVIARAYGVRRERRARRAELLRLASRVAVKRLLGRPNGRERVALSALRAATTSALGGC